MWPSSHSHCHFAKRQYVLVVTTWDVVVIGAGQSGLAAAGAARAVGLEPLVLEAGDRPVGSWPRYYDSLSLFSPARYSGLPGMAFSGDPDRYPGRDEVVEYLARCAATLEMRLGVEIRTGQRVSAVRADGPQLLVELTDGGAVGARRVVAATGSFGRPYTPALPGLERFTGTVLHAAQYREPGALAGRRVVVVGAGNSAVQIAVELARHAEVTLASRAPVRFVAQRPAGRDVHFWLRVSGVDAAPVGRWVRHPPTQPVFDTGRYRAAVAAGRPDRRPLFTGLDGRTVTWSDGRREDIDVLVLATGYRPDVGYLEPVGALDAAGEPVQVGGLSSVHRGVGFVGLEWQRTPSSASLRGVGRDARHVLRRLARAGEGAVPLSRARR
jgi:putative flavoprotein involved in K+ transport